MLTAPRQPNILDEILCAREEHCVADSGMLEELDALLYLYNPGASKIKQGEQKNEKNKKKKCSAYISPNIFGKLEKLRYEMHLLFPEEKKNTFSRSNLLETAVARMLQEFKEGESPQDLLRLLLKK